MHRFYYTKDHKKADSMTKRSNIKKDTKQFTNELKAVNPNLTVIGEYVNCKTKIKYICNQCGREDKKVPTSLLQGHGCKYCATRKRGEAKRHSNEWLLEQLKEKNPGVVPLESYKTCNEKIRCKCVCGNEWYVSPANLLQGKRCRKCMGKRVAEKQMWDDQIFVAKLQEINPRIEPLEKYKGIFEEIVCRCTVCGSTWKAKPRQLLKGRGCKSCQRRWQTSFPEQALYYYIHKVFPEALNSYTEGFYPSELDIFIPTIKVGVEYDGRAHHSKITRTEIEKYNRCKKKGIYLIRVRERIETIPSGKICDVMIHSEFGDTKKYSSLDECIIKVFEFLRICTDINVERDSAEIREQYFTELRDKSFGGQYPELAKEWDVIKNGSITPYMVAPKSGDSFYWICPKCGHSYPASPATRAAGHGCAVCAGTIRKKHEDFIAEMSEIAPDIIVLEEYRGANARIKIKCRQCGKEDITTPHELLGGRRCKYCSKKKADLDKTLPKEEFMKRAKERSPGIEIIGEYTNSHSRIKCRCKKCGYVWEPEAHTLYDGNTGCKKCAGNMPTKIICVETGEIFKSMYQVEKKKGINHSSLHKCLHGKGKTAGGYHWRAVKNDED